MNDTQNSLKYKKILIVDDSQFFRKSVIRILKDANIGKIYIEAADGIQGVTQFYKRKPHITIMDIVMPKMDGIRATQKIRQIDSNAKIIVISAKENREIVKKVVTNYGAKDYVLKPCDNSAIVMAVSKQLVQSRTKKKIIKNNT